MVTIKINPGYYNSADHYDKATKYKVRDEFKSLFQPHIDSLIVDYKIIFCNYNVKKSGTDSKLFLHQDYSYADEDEYMSLNAWTPLTDLRLDNSFLGIVKASNKFVNRVHGRNMGSKYSNITDYITGNFTEKLLVNSGTIVIWDHCMLHHSPPNTSGKIRIALSNIMIPKEAEVVQYILEPEEPTVMKAYKVDEDFLINVRPNEAIVGWECFKRQPYERTPVTEAEFASLYKKANNPSLLSRLMDRI